MNNESKKSKKAGLLSVREYIEKYNITNARGHNVSPQAIFNKIYRYERGEAGKPNFDYIKDAGGIWVKD